MTRRTVQISEEAAEFLVGAVAGGAFVVAVVVCFLFGIFLRGGIG